MIDWTTTALLFPGQGSQEVGMGADTAAAWPEAAAVFQAADDALGFSLSALCWDGPAETLNDTINTQPALYTAGIATLKALEAALGPIQPAYVAGHSLGEITALAAAGALPFADGLHLVRERGRLMKQAGEQNPGAMAAVLGLSAPDVNVICAQAAEATGQRLILANDNCPGQIVISGDDAALEHGMMLAKDAGARRVVKLAVSIAAHSPLMVPVQAEFRAALEQTAFSTPGTPIIGNVNAAPLADADAVRGELGAQLTSTVRWTESIEALLAAGVTTFVELGPKDVLTGLVKRINRKTRRYALNSAEAIRAFVDAANA